MQTRSGGLLNVALALALAGAAHGATLEPGQFAYGMPIATPSEAAEYRLEIPPEVYLKSVQPGLRDLQIFNGKGEPVPFTIEPLELATRAKLQYRARAWHPVGLFAVNQMRDDIDRVPGAIPFGVERPLLREIAKERVEHRRGALE